MKKKYTLELTSQADSLLVYELSPAHMSDDGVVTSTGIMKYGDRLLATVGIQTPDIFTEPKKPKPALKMIAYVLAYYLALIFTEKKSNEAKTMVIDWFGKSDPSTVQKARRNYSIPKGSMPMIVADPPGVIVLIEPKKLTINDGLSSYSGRVWAWRVGDAQAFVGNHSFSRLDDLILIPSQLPNSK